LRRCKQTTGKRRPRASVIGARAKQDNWEEILVKRLLVISAALLIAAVGAVWHSPPAASEPGWVTLFDGKNLDNWNQVGDANWRIENGAVVADKGNGFLVSKNDYADFQVRAEFYVEADSNSGIFIRCTDPNKIGTASGYEVNIWDNRPEPDYGTGAIVNVAKVVPMPKAGGKWNTYDITAQGSSFLVILNGQKTVNGAKDDKFAKGRIALQFGTAKDKIGPVKFRKVEVKGL
jgi:hypothetical protein